MKKLSLLAAVFASAMLAQASLQVNWQASAGFYWDPSYDSLNATTVAYLVYDADGDVGDISAGSYGVSDSIGTGGTILDMTSPADTTWGSFSAVNYVGTYVAGYVYAIIFQDNAIDANDYYYYRTIATVDTTGLTLPQTLEMNTDLTNGDPINTGLTTGQVIPEPATFGLLGLGAVSAWFLRRAKKAKIEA